MTSPALQHFLVLFNQQKYWEAHEALEAEWRLTGSEFLHGLILYASAWVHVQRGNAHGVLAQLAKAGTALEPYRPTQDGVNVEEILRTARAMRAALEGDGDWPRLVALDSRLST
jgi:predicted metal-dependent hydrolase